jgi:hypothetical protein
MRRGRNSVVIPFPLRISVAVYGSRGHAIGGEPGHKPAAERIVGKMLEENPDDPARSAFIDQLLARRYWRETVMPAVTEYEKGTA